MNIVKIIIDWILGLWKKIPESTREAIIDAIIHLFETIFRNYYKTKNEEKEESNE
jgi:hypothetical protein